MMASGLAKFSEKSSSEGVCGSGKLQELLGFYGVPIAAEYRRVRGLIAFINLSEC